MEWCALGDSAWLCFTAGDSPHRRLAEALGLVHHLEEHRIPEVTDLVSSFDSVAVCFPPHQGARVRDWLAGLPALRPVHRLPRGRLVEVPVVYGGEQGPDLGAVAAALGWSEEEVVKLHCGAEYLVACLGFAPGFPYLAGLPEALRLPRRATPRPVAAGSVAVAGHQAGVYPVASQGGWHVLGRTALPLFDPSLPEPSTMRAGDRVRFLPVQRLEVSPWRLEPLRGSPGAVELIKPGAFTTVQDLGRWGFQAQGVSPGGAADPVAARVANRLVGNPEGAALLECSMNGPVLEFHEPVRMAWVGWEDQRSGRPVEMAAGGQIDLRGPLRGLRGYVAFAGGIDVPQVLGSRATDVRGKFGGWHGRILRPGDRLPLGRAAAGPRAGNWRVRFPYDSSPGETLELRCLRSAQSAAFGDAAWERFRHSTFRISMVSDRMGARLEGPDLRPAQGGDMVSLPVVTGSVQVPPDGLPIVLLAERQTIGGYPQIAHVISADLPLLARSWPGTPVRFREVSLEEAWAAWANLQRELGVLQSRLDLIR